MFEKKNIGTVFTATAMLVFAVVIAAISGRSYLAMRTPAAGVDRVVPHTGFEHRLLSDYFEGIRGTPADTDVYIQAGDEAGGTILVLGGTHANEPAGVIAAVVIGGTSLMGGRGSVWGTLVGAVLIGAINNGMNLLLISSYYQLVVKGVIIVAAVLLDRLRE